MMARNWLRLLIPGACLAAFCVYAQAHYSVVKESIVKQRLDFYKGNDAKREAALIQLFEEAGCSKPRLTEQDVPSRKQPNVLCVLPGSTEETIVVGAHFDHVSEGEGVIDNWSGAALLPSLFQSLAGSPRKHTFVFVGFTGEEEGLIGSSYYVQQLSANQIAKIEAMINLDTLGLDSTKIWVSQSDPRLVNGLANLAHAMDLPVQGVNVNGFGESDEESFIAEKVCALVVHSLTPQNAHILHGPEDNPSAMHFSDYYDTYRLLAAYLTLLDTSLQQDGHVCTATPVEDFSRRRRMRVKERYIPSEPSPAKQ